MNLGIKGVLSRISVFFILYLILLSACLIIKISFSREEIYFAVNGYYGQAADVFFKYITNVGDGLTIVALSIVLLLFFSYRKAFLLISSYGVTAIIAQILKFFFDAPRPKLYFTGRENLLRFVDGVDIYTLHSFPSGHSVTIFSAAVVFTYLCRNRGWGVVFFIIAVLVGYSRMYLSEHFFEDVVAGSVIGVMVTVLWLSWINNRRFIHSFAWNKALLKK